tara:strand:+ start:1992 stop:2300 length:309 start_codon:yes stop_codon:yes gene_type:complete
MPQKDPTAEHRPLEHCLGPITRSRAIGVKEAPYRHRPPELALISKPLHSLDRVVVALNAMVGELGGVVQGVTGQGVGHERVGYIPLALDQLVLLLRVTFMER